MQGARHHQSENSTDLNLSPKSKSALTELDTNSSGSENLLPDIVGSTPVKERDIVTSFRLLGMTSSVKQQQHDDDNSEGDKENEKPQRLKHDRYVFVMGSSVSP